MLDLRFFDYQKIVIQQKIRVIMFIDFENFVESNLGVDNLKQLKNIHQGGINNSKGTQYEQYYLLFKTFEIASNKTLDLSKQYLKTQVYGFVDDIVYCDKQNSIKHNYQAKNSNGQDANWNDKQEQRFLQQREIDLNFFGFNNSYCYLLVSDINKANINKTKIAHTNFNCEFFPYYKNVVELLEYTPFKECVDNLIEPNATPADRNYATSLILGILSSNQLGSVQDIFENAQSEAHPNPFVKFRQLNQAIPDWLIDNFENLKQHIEYELHYGRLKVKFKQVLEISVDLNALPNQPPTQSLNIEQLIELLMQCSIQRLQNPNLMGELK